MSILIRKDTTAIPLNVTLIKSQVLQLQANLDLRNPIFSLLDRELFDLRKNCVRDLTGRPKKCLMLLVNSKLRSFLNRDSTVLAFFT